MPSDRIESLDAFRGLAIASMILVNNPGSWAYVYGPLLHAEWHGWTPTDLVFPFFLFAVGVSIPVALERRLEAGASRSSLLLRVARRSLALILLGLLMRAVPDFDLGDMRLYGVLQRIGLVYFAAAALYIWVGSRGRLVITGSALLLYWAALTLIPVPGHGAGDLSPDGNLAAYIDRALMGGRLWQGTWDPEGLLSTVPSVATSLLGVATGNTLLAHPRSASIGPRMVVCGAVLTVVGLAWDLVHPINKNLWTGSYVLFSAGVALVILGAMHRMIDAGAVPAPQPDEPVRPSRPGRRAPRWHRPLAIYGMNAITVFVASGMTAKALIRIPGSDGGSLHAWFYEHLYRSWAGAVNGSLAFALTCVVFWYGVAWLLHRRGTYLRV